MGGKLGDSFRHAIEKRWYGKPGFLNLLSPLEYLFKSLASKRRAKHTSISEKAPLPVIVVGNINVGGTGKTPVIVALVKLLQRSGFKPGVVSRGYGRKSEQACLLVSSQVVAQECGDEPALIFQQTGCSVVVDEDRVRAAQYLAETQACDVILTDDGLQHYRLQRDIEIAVVDGGRLFGNERLLPVGPLRESVARLNDVDWVLINLPADIESVELPNVSAARYEVTIQPVSISQIKTGRRLPIAKLKEMTELHALAGLGNPSKFFATLDALDLNYTKHTYPDHHDYSEDDLRSLDGKNVIMTDKDAVKCDGFVTDTMYSLNVELNFPQAFMTSFLEKVNNLVENKPE